MSRHPICQYTEQSIIHELPRACPMRSRDPLDVLHAYKDSAWHELGESANSQFSKGDNRGSLDLLDMVDCCNKCLPSGILSDRKIQRLRTQAIGETPPR